MLRLLIRYTTIIFCGNYIYQKLLHIQTKPPHNRILFHFINIFCITTLSYILPDYLQYFVLPALIFITFFYYASTTLLRIETIFTSIVISYSICYAFFFLAGCIVYLFLCIPFFVCFNKTMHYLCSQILIAIVQIILCCIPFQMKRLKKGMPFLYNHVFSKIGVLISSIILFCSMFISSLSIKTSNIITKYYLFPIPFILLFALFIFMWWRNQIQQSYLLQLKERDCERLEKQLELYKEKLSIIEKENQELSKLIHRDNKLIPSMQLALQQFLETQIAEASSEKTTQKGKILLNQLEQEMLARNGIVMHLSHPEKKLVSSGTDTIDQLLTYMHQKSIKEHITLEVDFSIGISEMLQYVISETDCLTILADLLENAQIAIKSSPKKGHIFLEMGRKENFYEIHIWDDGIPFAKEVLYYLGKKRYTTHKKEGGSGIGIMNTYSLLQTYHASLIIDERVDVHPIYSKKMSIIFDQQQAYRLFTNRPKDEIRYLEQRSDLTIITEKEYLQ